MHTSNILDPHPVDSGESTDSPWTENASCVSQALGPGTYLARTSYETTRDTLVSLDGNFEGWSVTSATVDGERQSPSLDAESLAAIQSKSWALSRSSPFTLSDQDDITQELTLAWTSTWKRFDGIRGTLAAFRKTVLERTAANLLAKARSKKRYSPTLTSLDAGGSKVGHPTDFDRDCRQTTSQSNSLSQHEKHDLQQDVGRAIETLPPHQQDLCRLLMHYTVADVSRLSGVPESTVSSRLGAIRRRFQSRRISEFL